ncbi:hypothetical protein MBRA1_003196 [Malassezia brasiliensis]|uniref:Pyridoxal phosphate homeostasis protein n=1 Tax=Malassezia brasiliensis TaxID=1821822 RepID=A0AAF0DZS6_9BASI|nr:hypothetical protein MBRA1_003196 [Malassezia brasiliensis]
MVYSAPVPAYNTGVQNSFAYESALHRWPAILTQAIDAMYRHCHTLSQQSQQAAVDEGKAIIERIAKLKYDITHDRPLETLGVTKDNAAHLADGYRAPPTDAYDAWIEEAQPTWFNAVWLYAECYLYRRLRHLFETSTHWQAYDPFFQTKSDTFLASEAGIHACAKLIQELLEKNATHAVHNPATHVLFDELVSSSLWGNATDLSLLTNLNYADLQKLQATSAEHRKEKQQFVLVNQLTDAWDALRSMDHGRVDIVLDNAGFELVTDLVLADWLLTLRGTIPRAAKERVADVRGRLEAVRARIDRAAQQASRPPPSLLAVSKLQPPSDVMAAFEAGQRHFGENYAQELVEKAHVLPQSIRWHLIGGLQSNKAKILAPIPNLYAVESIDSEKLATSLEKALAKPENELRRSYPLHVYLQVNTSGEEGKSGVTPMTTPWDGSASEPPLLALAKHILLHCPHLRLAGLMTIGALANSQQSRDAHHNPDFEALVATRSHLLHALRTDSTLQEQVHNTAYWLPDGSSENVYATLWGNADDALELSMGMSADLETAVAYGSGHVRIGSDCFGPRSSNQDAAKVRELEIQRVADVPLVQEVVFHTKNLPWFVSDTCVPDVWYTIEQLCTTSMKDPAPVQAMAKRWKAHFDEKRFRLQMPHDAPLGADAGELSDFWTMPYGYGTMNYRKLTQDAEWPADIPFNTALGPLAGRFPILALRTCKAEVFIGT